MFYLRIIKHKFKDRIKKKLQPTTGHNQQQQQSIGAAMKKTWITCYDEKIC